MTQESASPEAATPYVTPFEGAKHVTTTEPLLTAETALSSAPISDGEAVREGAENEPLVDPHPNADDACDDPDGITDQLLMADRKPAVPSSDVTFKTAGRDYHQPHIEAALLSLCFNRPDQLDKIFRTVDQEDFFVEYHSMIYESMLEIYNAGGAVNYQQVLSFIVNAAPEAESDITNRLNAIAATSVNFKHVKIYVKMLKEAAIIRGGKDYCPHSYSENFCANLLIARLPEIRCVGNVWYRYEKGAWGEVKSHIYRPSAIKAIHPSHRTSRRGNDVLTHVESLSQFSGRFHGAYRFVDEGSILINGANCVIKVTSRGEISQLDHSPDFAFTLKLATSYDSNADCTLFDEKLKEMLPDPEDHKVLQMFFGYVLYPSCRLETALVAYGPGGTGKSTVASVVADVLGPDLVGSSGLEELCKDGSYSLPTLKNKLLNIASELASSASVESANFKKIASGEALSVRQIYAAPEEMRTNCKLLFLTNQPPRFENGSDAEARRLRILHFDRKPLTADTDLKENLSKETPGVLNWMLEGLVQLLRTKKIPQGGQAAKAVLAGFCKTNDPVGSFVSERCNLDPSQTIAKGDLFAEFCEWCEDNGLCAEKLENLFWKVLKQRHPNLGNTRLTISGTRTHCLTGINLITPREALPKVLTAQRNNRPRASFSPALLNKLTEAKRRVAEDKELQSGLCVDDWGGRIVG